MKHLRLGALAALLFVMAACTPYTTQPLGNPAGGDRSIVLGGPYQGCIVQNGGWAVDCDYPNPTWGWPRPTDPVVTEDPSDEEPPVLTPGQPVPLPDPDPVTEPRPEPEPIPAPDPEPTPDPTPEPCKPGWGYGDENHCHDDPPGRS